MIPRIIKLLLILLLCGASAAQAQRRVTPVKPSEPLGMESKIDESKRKPQGPPPSVVKQIDDSGREILVDTISGSEYVDSVALSMTKVIGNIYPLFSGVSVGLDLWNPLMRAFGQDYGLGGVWAEVSLHNRYFPVFEFGMGNARSTPELMNYTYRSPAAPYFKLGLNYNFLYNSNPDYQLYAGVRYGLSHFTYSIDDITVTDSYWGETTHFSIPSHGATAGYGEFLVGLKVKIAGPWTMGWNVRLHKMIHLSACPNGKPWYIPGFGTRNSALGVQLSVIYNLNISKESPNNNE